MDSIYDLIMKIRPRPAIYLGNKDIRLLNAFINGYTHAGYESGMLLEGDDNWLYHGFRVYLAVKYNDRSARGWAGLIEHHEPDGSSTDAFFRLLDEFLQDSRWYPYNHETVCEAEESLFHIKNIRHT